jgi:hypothetical protein
MSSQFDYDEMWFDEFCRVPSGKLERSWCTWLKDIAVGLRSSIVFTF